MTDFSKPLLLIVVAGLAACSSGTEGMQAWTHPDGRFSVAYPLSWTDVDDRGPALLMVESPDSAVICGVNIGIADDRGTFTQSELNDMTAARAESDFRRDMEAYLRQSIEIVGFEHRTVDGVEVIDMEWVWVAAGVDIVRHNVDFLMPQAPGLGMTQHVLSCAGRYPPESDDREAMVKFLESLSFSR